MKRITITGSSGYLGSCLIKFLRQKYPESAIQGLDIVEPRDASGHDFVKLDICSPQLEATLKSFQPDTVIHMAFVVPPMHDERKMHQINIGGSRNVLDAVSAVSPRRLLVTSSATSLGAWPDNPVPLHDEWPMRGRTEFRYAADKTELEQMVAQFAQEHREIAVSWVRPCIVGGPHMDNYLRRVLLGTPIIVLIDGSDTPLQLVHEDDVSAAIHEILLHDGRGPYNVCPPDWLHLSEIAAETKRRKIAAPFWLTRFLAAVAWKTRFPLHEYPPGLLYFIRYPWVTAPVRLQKELRFRFRFSSRDTLLAMIGDGSHGPG